MKIVASKYPLLAALVLCSVAVPAAAAGQPTKESASRQGYTRSADPYLDGARAGKWDPFTEGQRVTDPRDSFTDGA